MNLVALFKSAAMTMPLELFVFIGSIVEEIIAPIPPFLVMTFGGSVTQSRGQGIMFVLFLAAIGALGKTLADWILYELGYKGGKLIIKKFGGFFGVDHKEVEKIGGQLNHGWRDDFIIFLGRAIPIIPSASVSIVCGVIKIDLKTYLIATMTGLFVRNLLYLYLGYTGLSKYQEFANSYGNTTLLGVTSALVLIGFFVWLFFRNKKKKI